MGGYLQYVALTTGRAYRWERTGLDDRGIEICATLLAEALAGGTPVVPGITPALSLTAVGEGHCLSAALRVAGKHDEPPVLTIGVAGKSRCGAGLWRSLHTKGDSVRELVTRGRPCPPEPWCAERVDGTGTLYVAPEVWGTLQNLERCMAWAFLERPRKATDAA